MALIHGNAILTNFPKNGVCGNALDFLSLRRTNIIVLCEYTRNECIKELAEDDEEKDVVHVVSPCHGKLYKTVSL